MKIIWLGKDISRALCLRIHETWFPNFINFAYSFLYFGSFMEHLHVSLDILSFVLVCRTGLIKFSSSFSNISSVLLCRNSYFHFSYHRRMPDTFAKQRPGVNDAYQTSKMETLFHFRLTTVSNIVIIMQIAIVCIAAFWFNFTFQFLLNPPKWQDVLLWTQNSEARNRYMTPVTNGNVT